MTNPVRDRLHHKDFYTLTMIKDWIIYVLEIMTSHEKHLMVQAIDGGVNQVILTGPFVRAKPVCTRRRSANASYVILQENKKEAPPLHTFTS